MPLSHLPILIARSLETQLDQLDQTRLRAAAGYVDLEMPQEADAELEAIAPQKRALPVVLSMRLRVLLQSGRWELAVALAKHFAREIEPNNVRHWIDWAYAARRAESVRAAQAILLGAEPLHAANAIVQFNLACYAAQLGELPQAKTRLARAIELDARYKLLALEEPDLGPLWQGDQDAILHPVR